MIPEIKLDHNIEFYSMDTEGLDICKLVSKLSLNHKCA